MVTIAQLRAVLSILRIDPSTVDMWANDRVLHGPNVDRVLLAGLLHRVASSELRQAVTSTMNDEQAARVAAVSLRKVDGVDPMEQVRFDARWLHDQIGALAAGRTVDPVPALLDAAARAAEAAEALLVLTRNPRGNDADTRWVQALDDLGRAYHRINDERVGHSNSTTAPL
ncbi:hypothetical protein [Nocardia sp. CNY236]|uniref:hypothetical protein n=1 Tax=Nocardia sp. CNY236 TaxID=1169152 RepID=UPI0003F69346|nr:hypothetical protein [Nocardia sp. CNY236]